jgi:dGTPase
MNIREDLENAEYKFLAIAACKSRESKGRERKEDECNLRTIFQRDRDRIIHSKSFRRLKHKTQVFLSPQGDHYRTRLTHTLEVSQIARTIGCCLRLNEYLIESIALGHDLGHTPFGHAGEAALTKVLGRPFKHYEQSVKVIQLFEKDGLGLNLSYEVIEGILAHSKGKGPIFLQHNTSTLESAVVRVADIIAYINHDIDDALRAGVLLQRDLPKDLINILGKTHRERIDRAVRNIILNTLSNNYGFIKMSDDFAEATMSFRDFLFEKVYESQNIQREVNKAKKILEDLFYYFIKNSVFIPELFLRIDDKVEDAAADYIAGMTDNFAMKIYSECFMPKSFGIIV